jgi:hypothetical protein
MVLDNGQQSQVCSNRNIPSKEDHPNNAEKDGTTT